MEAVRENSFLSQSWTGGAAHTVPREGHQCSQNRQQRASQKAWNQEMVSLEECSPEVG